MAGQAGAFFERYAHDFEAIYAGGKGPWSRFINRTFRRSMLLRYQRSLESCAPAEGKSILDIGCGPGHYCVALAKSGAARVVGVDEAPAMIELARKRAQDHGVDKHCEFICSTWEAFQSPGRFDHAICMGFLEYQAEPLAAVARVLACTRISAVFSLPDRLGILAWQRRLRYRLKTALHMYTEAEVKALFSRVPGLGDFAVERLERDFFVTVTPEA
jgi:ubiquinone/menaquinone biosynthesis C-methylase UbiE